MDEISVAMIVVTLWETFGWLTVIGAMVALIMLVLLFKAFVRRRAGHQPFAKLFWRGIVVMLVVAAVLTPFVPVWTLAPVGDLRGPIDYIMAYGMALAPASAIGVLWVYLSTLGTPKTA
jgi:cell division protein FtsW (lipid II flippase)